MVFLLAPAVSHYSLLERGSRAVQQSYPVVVERAIRFYHRLKTLCERDLEVYFESSLTNLPPPSSAATPRRRVC